MPLEILLIFLLLGAASLLCSALAATNAKSRGRYSLFGIFAGREVFTPQGWRYRNWALALFALAFLVLLAWGGWEATRA